MIRAKRIALSALPCLFAATLASPALAAQLPDCHVFLHTANSPLHSEQISVDPSAQVTIEAHCAYGPGDPEPSFSWFTGSNRFDTTAAAPGAPGASATISVNVTQGGVTRLYSGRIDSAATGAPHCTLSVDPPGSVPVFTPVSVRAACPGATDFTWTSSLDFRGQGTATVTVFGLLNAADPGVLGKLDVFGSNGAGAGSVASANLKYSLVAPNCRLTATPAGVVQPGQSVTIASDCDGDPNSFTWSTRARESSITVAPTSTTEYSATASNASGVGAAALLGVAVSTTPPPVRNYTGAWWGGDAENGWGITVNQHENRPFAVIYMNDPELRPTFAVMSGGTWNADSTVFTGDLYVPTSSWLGDYQSTRFNVNQSVGSLTLTFTDANTMYASASLAYAATVAPFPPVTTRLQKKLSPLLRNSGTNPSGKNFGDLWWGGTSQNGWGLSITQTDSLLFAAWYTYSQDGRPFWYIFQSQAWSGNTITGTIYSVTANPLLGRAFNASATVVAAAGSGTMSFSDDSNGTFTYTVEGVTQTKAISRLPF